MRHWQAVNMGKTYKKVEGFRHRVLKPVDCLTYEIEEGVIYLYKNPDKFPEYTSAVFLCPCGCGWKHVVPQHTTDKNGWHIILNQQGVTLGNENGETPPGYSFAPPCGNVHYFIKNGEII